MTIVDETVGAIFMGDIVDYAVQAVEITPRKAKRATMNKILCRKKLHCEWEGKVMGKGMDSKKSEKKEPAKSMKEKKADKKAKKAEKK